MMLFESLIFNLLPAAVGIMAVVLVFEAEATRLKGESEGAAEKAHGEGVAAGIKAQAEAYNGMDNPYLLANRYIDIQVASGLKDSTGIDLPSLLNGLISNPDIDAGSAENSVE